MEAEKSIPQTNSSTVNSTGTSTSQPQSNSGFSLSSWFGRSTQTTTPTKATMQNSDDDKKPSTSAWSNFISGASMVISDVERGVNEFANSLDREYQYWTRNGTEADFQSTFSYPPTDLLFASKFFILDREFI